MKYSKNMTNEQIETMNAQPLSSSSSTASTCSSGNNSSSSLVSSSNGSNNSYPNSNSSKCLTSKVQLNEIAYDFGAIMSDLKIACGTLSLLARQIDSVVGKIDEKFGFIFESLNTTTSNKSSIEIVTNSNNKKECNIESDFMNCMKRTNVNLNNINNRNFTKIIKNDLNGNAASPASNKSAKNQKQHKNAYENGIVNYGVGTNGVDVLNLIENRLRDTSSNATPGALPQPNGLHLSVNCNQQTSKCSQNYGVSSASSLSSTSSNNSNSIQQPYVDHNNKNKQKVSGRLGTNEYAIANIINKESLKSENNGMTPVRAISERKASVSALLSNFVGLQLNGQNKTNSLKADNASNFHSNSNGWNSESGSILASEASSNQFSSSNSPFNAPSTFILNDTISTSSKIKCTRSKSQPVFNKETYNSNSNGNRNYGSIPTSESQKASLYGCSSFKSPLLSSSQMQNKTLTSSPICNFDPISENEISRNKSQNIQQMCHDNHQNDSSNPESSFYEDQLDNELESFSDSMGGLTVRSAESATNEIPFNNSNKNKVVKIIPPVQDLKNDFGKSIDTNNTAKINGIKSIQNSRTKSGNSNHHVSFNINNAIYTSRQETPIPISILKQSINQSFNNNKSLLCNTNSNTFENYNNNNNDSSKKNGTINTLEKDRVQSGNKSARSDSKTTIL